MGDWKEGNKTPRVEMRHPVCLCTKASGGIAVCSSPLGMWLLLLSKCDNDQFVGARATINPSYGVFTVIFLSCEHVSIYPYMCFMLFSKHSMTHAIHFYSDPRMLMRVFVFLLSFFAGSTVLVSCGEHPACQSSSIPGPRQLHNNQLVSSMVSWSSAVSQLQVHPGDWRH